MNQNGCAMKTLNWEANKNVLRKYWSTQKEDCKKKCLYIFQRFPASTSFLLGFLFTTVGCRWRYRSACCWTYSLQAWWPYVCHQVALSSGAILTAFSSTSPSWPCAESSTLGARTAGSRNEPPLTSMVSDRRKHAECALVKINDDYEQNKNKQKTKRKAVDDLIARP